MAVNKNKVVALAQRYTAKGQFEKAIVEYRKLLKVDPNDIRTWLKIGDLYTRMGARKEATETYIRVAEQYTNSGFHLKAIAVFKQILNIDPTLVVVHQYLAVAYLELGLTSEALIQLEQLADVYERTGRDEPLLEVLMQMGKIDAHNIATRLRIAELLSKQKRVKEAANHFSMACDELKSQGRNEDFMKVAERLLYHDATRVDIAKEMAAIYLEKNRYKEALSKLQICFSKDPKNVEVLELLARAFAGLGQPEKAVSVYLEIAGILEAQGENSGRLAVLRELLTLDPENETALAALRESAPPGSDIGLRDTTGHEIEIVTDDTETELDEWTVGSDVVMQPEEIAAQSAERIGEAQVLLKYGLKERALDHLGKIFEVDPYNIDAREIAKDILIDLERESEALDQLFILADAFQETQPEGSIYYLHEILKIDARNQRARQMIRDLGGIMPEGLSDMPEIDPMEDEVVVLDEDEDILLIDNDDLEEAGAILIEDEKIGKETESWTALPPDSTHEEKDGAAEDLLILDGESGELQTSDDIGVIDLHPSSNIGAQSTQPDILEDSDNEDEEEVVEEFSEDMDAEEQGSLDDDSAEFDPLAMGSPFDLDFPDTIEAKLKPSKRTTVPAETLEEPISEELTSPVLELSTIAEPKFDEPLLAPQEAPGQPAPEMEQKEPTDEPTPEPIATEAVEEEPVVPSERPEVQSSTAETMTSEAPAIEEKPSAVPEAPVVEEKPSVVPEAPIEAPEAAPTPELEAAPSVPTEAKTATSPSIDFDEETLDAQLSAIALDAIPAETEITPETEEPPPLADIDDELEEIEFFMSQDLEDEAKAVLEELLKKSPGDPRLRPLCERLSMGGTLSAPAAAAQPVSPNAEVSAKKSTEGSVQFKNVGIKETLSDSDSNTTWDLGLAYKEMGLFDDAIQAFEIAARDRSKTAMAKTMIGMCYSSLSKTDLAVQTFVEGLEINNLDSQQKMGLLYELGKTYQMVGKNDDAINCYHDILALDPSFADVASRVDALKTNADSPSTGA